MDTNEETKEFEVVADGKTKTLYSTNQRDYLFMEQKDNLTYKNGLINESIPEIGKYKALQNDFAQNFLKRHGVDAAYEKLMFDNLALVKACEMLGLEIVYRNDAEGESSWAKRNPNQKFDTSKPVFEIFDKRTLVVKNGVARFMDEGDAVKTYGDDKDVHSDPYVQINADKSWGFYDQKKPIIQGNLLTTTSAPYTELDIIKILSDTQKVQELLTRGLALVGKQMGKEVKLIDGKVEFGKIANGNIVLSDDITADAVRMKVEGRQSSKQVFRDACDEFENEQKGHTPAEKDIENFKAKLRTIMPEVYKRTTDVFAGLDNVTL